MNELQNNDGKYEFFENEYNQTFLVIQSELIEEHIKYYKEHNLENLMISWYKGFYLDSIEFVNSIYVRGLILNTLNIKSVALLNNQINLKFLAIDSDPVKEELDFNNFRSLKIFKGFWTKNLKNLFACKTLKVLWLWKYKSPTEDLSELAELENLEEVHIIQSNIKSCKGLENLKKLKKIGLSYNRSLEVFTNNSTVTYPVIELEIEMCKKFNLTLLEGLKNLKTLKIINNGKLETLKPVLNQLPKLEYLQFTEGELVENNNLYLLEHPTLQHVFLSDKKRYLLTNDEINKALKSPHKKEAILKKYK